MATCHSAARIGRRWDTLVFIVCLLSVVTLFADVTTGVSIGEGNTVSFSFNPINIPGGPPPGWGNMCGLFVIGQTSGGALWYQTLEPPSTKGYVFALDFMLGRTAMADGSLFSFAVSKATGPAPPTPGTPLNWRQYVVRIGNLYKLVFVVGEGDHQISWYYPKALESIRTLVVYRPQVTYDIAHQQVMWEVDGIQVGAMPMSPGHPQTVQHQVIGSSGSSTARNTTFLVDRVKWVEIQ